MLKILALLTLLFSTKTVIDAGQFKDINPHFNGSCEIINDIPGAEDITILSNGLAIISSDFRRKIGKTNFIYPITNTDKNSINGNIFFYDLNSENPSPVNMTSDLNMEFHPHGISAFLDSDNNIYLSVVNHTSVGEFIELFYYNNIELVHVNTINSPLLISPNDIVLVNQNQFYVTNDHGTNKSIFKIFEDYLQTTKSNILFYNGNDFIEVKSNLQYANGINISNDKKTLYCAETIGKKLNIYNRNLLDNSLTLVESIEIDSGLDNIEVDLNDNIYIGAHPKLFDFLKHAKDKSSLAPSQIFKISNDYSLVDEIYLNDGNDISASTVGAFYNDILLIGALFDNHFLHCQIDNQSIY